MTGLIAHVVSMASGMKAFYDDCKLQLKTMIEEFEESIVKEIMAQMEQLRCAINDVEAVSLGIDSKSLLINAENVKGLDCNSFSEKQERDVVNKEDGKISDEVFRYSAVADDASLQSMSEVCLCVFILKFGKFVYGRKLYASRYLTLLRNPSCLRL